MNDHRELRQKYLRSLIVGWVYLIFWVTALLSLIYLLDELTFPFEVVWSLVLAALVPSLTDLKCLFSSYEEFTKKQAPLESKRTPNTE